MPNLIYKVCGSHEWAAAQRAGTYRGSVDDARDGYIHFSTWGQLPGTLAKHFKGRRDLVLIAFDAGRIAASKSELVWEPARGGTLFPHLYGPLSLDAAVWTRVLETGTDGVHVLPAEDGAC